MYEHVRVQSYMLMYDEILLHWILLLYVLAQGVYQLAMRTLIAYNEHNWWLLFSNDENYDASFNGVSVSLLLSMQFALTAQMQCSYDNPFFSILLFIFGIRNSLKFFNLIRVHVAVKDRAINEVVVRLPGMRTLSPYVLKFGHWVADTVVYASLLVLGLRLSAEGSEAYVTTVAGMLFMSLLAGAALHAQSHSGN
jgi:hypothetical protein